MIKRPLLLLAAMVVPTAAKAAETGNRGPSLRTMNLVMPTLGGTQFWADEFVFAGWRIQRNTVTKHCRLLDANNLRHAWGSFDQCVEKFESLRTERQLPPMRGKAVILVHGLFRNRTSMTSLGSYLEKEGDYTALTFGYASTQADVEIHASHLARVLASLEGVEQIDLVAHSLGNIVIRHYLSDASKTPAGVDPRIKRIVMLGAPNNGAQIARTFSRLGLFKLATGSSGVSLADGWSKLAENLATPTCEFGIIAGGRGDGRGYNPMLTGDDDFVVTVEETRLPGARDFALVPTRHTWIMDNAAVQEKTLRFLTHGYFESEETRQPIVAEEVSVVPVE